MSIKGNSQELFIGKTEANIRNWNGDKTKILYDNLSKIEYCFCSLTEGGYMDFHDSYGHFERFHFPRKSNEPIQRAIDYIAERFPELEITKHDSETDPFYTKNIFISIISIFCTWPIGLILCWCTGKRTTKDRILFTVVVIIIQISIITFWYWYNQMQMNAAIDTVNDYFNQINSLLQ